MSDSARYPGILHRIPNTDPCQVVPLVAFEHIHSPGPSQPSKPPNTLIFLGGLGDGPLSVPYIPPLVASLGPSWSLVAPILGSAYRQWGIASLDEDVAEIGRVVTYFRGARPEGKMVLLGHSTGSQMIMHYLLSPISGLEEGRRRPGIDGGVMQACISDRETLVVLTDPSTCERINTLAQEYVNEGNGRDVLPSSVRASSIFGSTPMSAERWLSIASPGPNHDGKDDYFSSDFGEERLARTFGQIGKTGARVAWLYGEKDPYVPDFVKKDELVSKWERCAREGGAVVDEVSGVIPGATHTLQEGGDMVDELVRRVLGFLGRVEGSRAGS